MASDDVARKPKRLRVDDGEDRNESSSSLLRSSHKSKKQEFLIDVMNHVNDTDINDSYTFRDGIGVFDFPWLKDGGGGVVFQVEEYLEAGDMFTSLCLDGPGPGWAGESGLEGHLWELGFDGGIEGLWSWETEDLESVECVWRCVVDDHQDVVENVTVNQACLEKQA